MGIERSQPGAFRHETRPKTMPPKALHGLLEDDDGVTGVVNVAHQNADTAGKDVDAQQTKLTKQMQKLQRRLLDSGPIDLRKNRPHSKR